MAGSDYFRMPVVIQNLSTTGWVKLNRSTRMPLSLGKLDRNVELQGLPAGMACDPKSLARFRREAQVQASLNYPNIP